MRSSSVGFHTALATASMIFMIACTGPSSPAATCRSMPVFPGGSYMRIIAPTPPGRDQLLAAASIINARAARVFHQKLVCVVGSAIFVQLPKPDKANGLTTAEEVRLTPLLATRGKLEMRPVLAYVPSRATNLGPLRVPDCRNPNTDIADDPGNRVVLCVEGTDAKGNPTPQTTWDKLLLGTATLDRNDLSSANAHSFQSSPVRWLVTLKLTSGGASKFERMTAALACNPLGEPTRQLAIIVDHVVISHPQLGDNVACHVGIAGRFAQITGAFDEAQARALVAVLENPPLPTVFAGSLVTS